MPSMKTTTSDTAGNKWYHDGMTSSKSSPDTSEVTRGKSEKVALAIRFDKVDWIKVHHFALARGTSIQKIMVRAISELMEREGSEGLKSK